MPSPDPPPPTSTTNTSTRFHPPTTTLLIYPATILLGCIFSILSPTANPPSSSSMTTTPPLAPSIATDLNTPTPPTLPINYFARKDNIFNLYFVKIGWFWTTLAVLLILVSQPAYTRAPVHRVRRTLQAGVRWVVATSVWYMITQWFFGPPIMDRGFVATGGGCQRIIPLVEGGKGGDGIGEGGVDMKTVVTAVACKSVGGAWRGGHDVSGHVFLLVVMVSVVVFEVVGAGRGWGGEDGEVKKDEGEKSEEVEGEGEVDGVRVWSGRFAWAVAGLGWWMLLMTAIWFHTWFEKVTGLLIALGTVYTIYILPQRVPAWRNVVGLPGV
ncbi:hypothetical protein BO78DRAFT_367026 [Aspergillus sclerotiicarbonarius CBS 121057]|uniref:Acyl-coenzyme A diphosphatase SCS3 n=1 Tax=Aspergillus sclerotiicarbonarius (strain CBS 121057 / IBT 28362) TaxID=1448318 RepID=A0A319EKJ2_ASPSB|nr:hypothetical protein BO78DRAFT_367026 [Aspergillus sclerotiicarbonarius CBS 121057]